MRNPRLPFTVLALLLAASVVQVPSDAQVRMLHINNAIYGKNGRGMNVTNKLRSMVQNNTLNIKVTNGNMGGDPNVGADKYLAVKYTYQGRAMSKVAKEGDRLQLP